MGLQEEAEGIARALSQQVGQMRLMNNAAVTDVCIIAPPYNPDMEAQIRLAALLVLDYDMYIEFDWSNWP